MSSATPAVHFLRRHGVAFDEHPYRYEERGGTRVSARELGIDEHIVVKTLVMQDDEREPLIVLMHGDREVSTKQLARQMGKRSVEPCTTAPRAPSLVSSGGSVSRPVFKLMKRT